MQPTIRELEVIEDFIARGAALVPQTITRDGRKVPPKNFFYQKHGHKIESAAEAERWMQNGFYISLYLHTADAVQVDFDCPLRMDESDFENSQHEYLEDYVKAKKEEWKSMPADQRNLVLETLETYADQAMPFHASMISSSGKGLHLYYRCEGEPPANMPADNIEVYTQIRLAIITFWDRMEDFWSKPAIPYEKVMNFWQSKSRTLAPVAKKARRRSRSSVSKDGIIMTGRNNFLFRAACQSYKYGDDESLCEAVEVAVASGLDEREIKATLKSADRTTDNPPTAYKLLARKEGRM